MDDQEDWLTKIVGVQSSPEASPPLEEDWLTKITGATKKKETTSAWDGFKQGIAEAQSSLAGPGGLPAGGLKGMSEALSKPRAESLAEATIRTNKERADFEANKLDLKGFGANAGGMAGNMLASLPTYGVIGGGLNKIAGGMAAKVASPLLKKILGNTDHILKTGSGPLEVAAKSALSRIPFNIVTGTATEAMVHPDHVDTMNKLAEVALMSATGSAFDGLFAGFHFNGLMNQAIDQHASNIFGKLAKGRILLNEANLKDKPKLSAEGFSAAVEDLNKLVDAAFPTVKTIEKRGSQLGLKGEILSALDPFQVQQVVEGVPLGTKLTDGMDAVNTQLSQELKASVMDRVTRLANGPRISNQSNEIILKEGSLPPDRIERAAARGIADRLQARMKGTIPSLQERAAARVELENQRLQQESMMGGVNEANPYPRPVATENPTGQLEIPNVIGGYRRAVENLGVEGSLGTSTEASASFTAQELQSYHDYISNMTGAKQNKFRKSMSRLEIIRKIALKGGDKDLGIVEMDPDVGMQWAREMNDVAEKIAQGFDPNGRVRTWSQVFAEGSAALRVGDSEFGKMARIIDESSPQTVLRLTDPEVIATLNRSRLINSKAEIASVSPAEVARSNAPFGQGAKNRTYYDSNLQPDRSEIPTQGASPNVPSAERKIYGPRYEVNSTNSVTPISPPTPLPPQQLAAAASSYQQSVDEIGKKVVYEVKDLSSWQKMGKWADEFRTRIVNKNYAIFDAEKRAGVKDPRKGNSVFNQFQILAGTDQEAEIIRSRYHEVPIIDPVTKRWTGENEILPGKPTDDIINRVGEDIKEFDVLMLAMARLSKGITEPNLKMKPNAVLDETGSITTGIDLTHAQNVVANAPQRLKDLAAEFQVATNVMLEYMQRAGLKSPKAIEYMKSSGFYASMERVMNDGSSSNSSMMRLGSEKDIMSPSITFTNNISKIVRASKRNMAWQALGDLRAQDPTKFAGLMDYVGENSANRTLDSVERLIAEAKKNGEVMPESAAKEIVDFMLAGHFDETDKTIRFMRNGLAETYRVDGKLALLADAMRPQAVGSVLAAARAMTSPIRSKVSLSLEVSGMGLMADTMEATVSIPGFIPIYHTARGMYHRLLETPEYLASLTQGRGFAGRYVTGAEPITFKSSKAGSIVKTTNVVLSPISWLSNKLRFISDANKVGAYLVMKDQGMAPMEAVARSRGLGGDLGQMGTDVKAMSMATEFFQVGVQSLDQLGIVLNRARKDPKAAMQLGVAGFAGITLPTLALYFKYKDDDDIQQARRAPNGNRYWFWKDADGQVQQTRVLGWELGTVFSTPFVTALDKLRDDDPNAFKRLEISIVEQFGINTIPGPLRNITGLATGVANPSITGMMGMTPSIPIVPSRQKNLLPEAQGNQNTSWLAKTMAEHMGVSPFKVDYLINSFGGDDIRKAVAMVFPNENSVKLGKSEIPIFGRYYSKFPAGQTEAADQFYEDLNKYREIKATQDMYMKTANSKGLEKLMGSSDYAEAMNRLPMYESMYAPITNAMSEIETISKYPSNILSPEEKKIIIDEKRRIINLQMRAMVEGKLRGNQ